jgi:O-antigen ligase
MMVFAAGIALAYCGRQERGHVYLVRAFCWTSAVASVLALGLAIYGGGLHPFDVGWRLGSEGHENQISQIAGVGFLAMALTKGKKDIWPSRAVLILTMVAPLVVVVLTKSRTTWFGLAAALLVAQIFGRGARSKKVAVVLSITVVLAGLFFASSFRNFLSRGESDVSLESASGRVDLWQRVEPEVTKRPLLGYGYGAFWSPDMIAAIEAEGWAATSGHNGYLDMVGELGIVGLAVLLGLLAASAKTAWQLMRHAEYYEVGLALLGLVVALVAMSAGESLLDDMDSYPMIMFLTLSVFVSHRLSLLHATNANSAWSTR